MTKMTQVLGYVCGSVGSLISCAAGPVMIQRGASNILSEILSGRITNTVLPTIQNVGLMAVGGIVCLKSFIFLLNLTISFQKIREQTASLCVESGKKND